MPYSVTYSVPYSLPYSVPYSVPYSLPDSLVTPGDAHAGTLRAAARFWSIIWKYDSMRVLRLAAEK